MRLKNVTDILNEGISYCLYNTGRVGEISSTGLISRDELLYFITTNHSIHKEYAKLINARSKNINKWLSSDRSNVESFIEGNNVYRTNYEIDAYIKSCFQVMYNYINFISCTIGLENMRKDILDSYMSIDQDAAMRVSSARYGFSIVTSLFSKLLFFKKEEDCFKMLNSITPELSSYSFEEESFINIMSICSIKSKDKVKLFIDENMSKNLGWKARSRLYKGIIHSGMLTKSIARKIRSDASEKASLNGLSALFESKELYEDFDDIVIKFCDTVYPEVASKLANNLDKNLLLNMIGCQFYNAKNIVSRRLSA
jgi:hypothetical protein